MEFNKELLEKMLEMSLLERLNFCASVIMISMNELRAREFEAKFEGVKLQMSLVSEEEFQDE